MKLLRCRSVPLSLSLGICCIGNTVLETSVLRIMAKNTFNSWLTTMNKHSKTVGRMLLIYKTLADKSDLYCI